MGFRIYARTASLTLIIGFMGAVAAAAAQQALREGEGVWVKGAVSGTSPACTQEWSCSPTEPVGISDQQTLSFSANQTTDGKCVRHEATDACRVCEAPPPAQACKWQVFEKS